MEHQLIFFIYTSFRVHCVIDQIAIIILFKCNCLRGNFLLIRSSFSIKKMRFGLHEVETKCNNDGLCDRLKYLGITLLWWNIHYSVKESVHRATSYAPNASHVTDFTLSCIKTDTTASTDPLRMDLVGSAYMQCLRNTNGRKSNQKWGEKEC